MEDDILASLDYIPRDALEEVLREEEKLKQKHKRKHPYPSSRDVVTAVIESVRGFSGHPDEFPDYVIQVLRDKGFDTRHVTIKRIWRTYELLVRKRIIADRLGVVIKDYEE